MSPDTVSTLFPDRPIRPLPKRRLRERLSPEVADSIKYPASTLNSIPLFQYPPYTLKDDDSTPRTDATSPTDSGYHNETTRNYTPRRNGTVGGREDDNSGAAARSTLVTRPSPEILSRGGGRAARQEQGRQTEPQPPPSAPSSLDGYDSFENTNNKKKRKIPSAGDAALGSTYGLNADAGSHLLPGVTPLIGGVHGDKSQPNGTGHGNSDSLGAGSPGFSGSGRGRLGRSMNGRTPLRTLSDGNNTWAGRTGKGSAPQWAPTDYEGSGIISSAIANAEKLPPQGQENVSLLQQHSAGNKDAQTSAQFTFTCDPQVPGTLQWPGHAARNSMGAHPSSLASQGNPPRQPDGGSKTNSRGSGHSRRENRRRLEKELNMAARHRQQMAAEQYFNNPPKLEDIWICEFCEYERIFGEPPRALIREYELKDRRARQEEADRKRLLEKAKAKGRKAKKNAKGASKGGNATNQQLEQPLPDDQEASPEHQANGHLTQSEEEDEEGYVDEYPDELANTSSQGSRSLRADEGGGEPLPHRTLPT